MAFQVLVKTAPGMLGSYSYDLGTREAAAEFVKRHDVWWYCFPVEEDTMDGSSWHRGGAWEAGSPHQPFLAAMQPEPAAADTPAVVITGRVLPHPDDDDDDDRW